MTITNAMKTISMAVAGATCFALATASGSEAAGFSYSGSGVDIPDNNPLGVETSINVADSFIISDVSVLLENFQHTWVGDLDVTLTHQDSGTSATLFDRPGVPPNTFGSSSDLDGNYMFSDGLNPFLPEFPADPVPQEIYSPNDSFIAAFSDLNAMGTWTLGITDNAGGDIGSLGSWQLNLEGESVEGESVPEPASILGLMIFGAIGVGSRLKEDRQQDALDA